MSPVRAAKRLVKTLVRWSKPKPAERRDPGFFDDYPRFFETSETTPFPNRLNKRYRAIFETLPGIVAGARVLDIASHDGRWSFAALKAGAKSVVGVEAREHLVRNASETLAFYGCAPDTFRFIQDDVFGYLHRNTEQFDVVLCLGYFYHTYRHPDLLALISQCAPRAIVIDTGLFGDTNRMACTVWKEPVERERNAAPDFTARDGHAFVAAPSKPLLLAMVKHFGFTPTEADWRAIIASDRHEEDVEDYVAGIRTTVICRASRMS